jgi:hypothetical protein
MLQVGITAVLVMSIKRALDTVAFLFMKGVFEKVKHSGNCDKNRIVLSQQI